MGASQRSYLKRLCKKLRINQCVNIEFPADRYSRYNTVKIGKIWRVSKNSYRYTANTERSLTLVRNYGRASTFDQALVLLFAYRKGITLTHHNHIVVKPLFKSTKGLYPHQEQLLQDLQHEKDRRVGIRDFDFSTHERRVAGNYHEQGMMAGMIYSAMNNAAEILRTTYKATRVQDMVFLEDPNTVTLSKAEYTPTVWPADKPANVEDNEA